MSPHFGTSPWAARFPSSRRPAFGKYRGDTDAEVVIVGGGLTGCATAYACAAAGFEPVVLEGQRIGTGSTALMAGLLLPDPGPAFRDLVQTLGLRTAKRAFTSWRRAALDAAALIRRLGITCALEPLDQVATAGADAEKELRREYQARTDAGIDATWLTERHVRSATHDDNSACGVRQPGAFAVDPYRACLGLAAAARTRGAVFHESSPVKRIRPGRTHVEIVADGGTVRAGAVIVATGSPGTLFSPLRRHFSRRDTYHVLTGVVPAPVRRQVMTPAITMRDSHVPPHRLRWTPDHRLLITGAEQDEAPVRRSDALVQEWTFELMYELLKIYPAISGLPPDHGWKLTSSVTRDGLPFIGTHRNYPRHFFALGGAASESATGAFLAARILVRALEGKPEAADEAFGFTR